MQNEILDDKKLTSRLYWWANRFLSFRLRSIAELTNYLEQKVAKYRPAEDNTAIVANLVARLIDEGALDDQKFVNWWVSERQYFKPRSKRLLTLELLQKGVEKELIEHYFDTNIVNDLETAKNLVRKKIDKLGQEKTKNYLLRKGFSYQVSKEAVENYETND